jgi:hypothetical protein
MDGHNCTIRSLPLCRRYGDSLRGQDYRAGATAATLIGCPAGSRQERDGIRRCHRRDGLVTDASVVVAGSTDGCAAFLATGADKPGHAVTSLGSTLVLKLASEHPVFAPEYGLYSHRIGDLWLAGGASNTGGAVLAQFFTAREIRDNSRRINPSIVSGLDYYPLTTPGERFPINDPTFEPRMTPRPDDDAVRRYRQNRSAWLPAHGRIWRAATDLRYDGRRRRNKRDLELSMLGVPVLTSESKEAAVGVARMALRALGTQSRP